LARIVGIASRAGEFTLRPALTLLALGLGLTLGLVVLGARPRDGGNTSAYDTGKRPTDHTPARATTEDLFREVIEAVLFHASLSFVLYLACCDVHHPHGAT